jgi:hypothetical protein
MPWLVPAAAGYVVVGRHLDALRQTEPRALGELDHGLQVSHAEPRISLW